MIIIWKNKGFFVLTYTVIFMGIMLFLSKYFESWFGGIFASNYSEMLPLGIAFILSGIATIITDVVTINNYKIEIDTYQMNEFFFVPMKQCGYWLIGFGILNLFFGFLES